MLYFDEVFTEEEIYTQYQIAIRGKHELTTYIKYEEHIIPKLSDLYMRLTTNSYIPGKDRKFVIYEPKRRIITANDFEDKIVQGILVRKVLRPLMEPKLIRDNYASRKGFGTDDAINRLSQHLHNYFLRHESNEGFLLKGDIRKYFYKIMVPIVISMINALPIDTRLKQLFTLEVRPYDGIMTGICIGHEISQWIAIYYLNELDHFIKEQLRIKYYSRYMDDFILLHSNKLFLQNALEDVRSILLKLELELNTDKTQILCIRDGVKFLGYHLYLTNTGKVKKVLLNSSIVRQRKRIISYKDMINDDPSQIVFALDSFNSWKSHAAKGCNKKNIYLLDIEFYNLYHDAMKALDIDYKNFCYLPGKYETNGEGKKNCIKTRNIIWASEVYSKYPIDPSEIKYWPY